MKVVPVSRMTEEVGFIRPDFDCWNGDFRLGMLGEGCSDQRSTDDAAVVSYELPFSTVMTPREIESFDDLNVKCSASLRFRSYVSNNC
jgi:hypothetical protein